MSLISVSMIELEWVHPPYWIVGCVLLGVLAAWHLYRNDTTLQEAKPWQKWLMRSLRALTVTTIGLLLLSPILKQLNTHTERKEVVLLQDNSASLLAAHDSTSLRAFDQSTQELLDDLKDKVNTTSYYFDETCNQSRTSWYDGRTTNLSNALEQIKEQFPSDRLSAIILATDGIYNEGQNPIYQTGLDVTPIFTIAMGDTTAGADIAVERVFHNRVTYKGDAFEVEVDLSATGLKDASGNLTLNRITSNGAQRIESRAIKFNRSSFFQTVTFQVQANEAGVQHYRVAFPVLEEESNSRNNYKDFYVDVIESRQKVLLLANAPHPDLNVMKQSLESLKNYQVDIQYAKNDIKKLRDYNLVVLHGLPSTKESITAELRQLKEDEVPVLYVLTTKTDLRAFNRAQSCLQVQQNQNQFTDAEPYVKGSFRLFTIDKEINQFVSNLPPLRVPFGSFSQSAGYDVLFSQAIKNVETNYPLITLGESSGTKVGVVAGDGIWKWRLFDYVQNQSFERFDGILSKIVQYLAVTGDKQRFKIEQSKNIYDENDRVILTAEYYNASYELKNDADINLTITNDEGASSSFAFSRTQQAYSLDLGNLSPGEYSYKGTLQDGVQRYDASGKFTVRPVIAELQHLRANHQLLKNLSLANQGQFYTMAQISQLKDELLNSNKIKPLYISEYERKSILNFQWILILLLLSLSSEWFMRKYLGSY